MSEKKEKQQIAKEALKVINELEQSVKLENAIKDNKIEFLVKDIKYRVRKPTPDEQIIGEKERRKKYAELVDDDSYFFRKQWVEKYKKKGIDIDKMDIEIRSLQKEIELLLLRLAKSVAPEDIKKLEKEINKLRNKQYDLSIEKTDLLSYSIEDSLLVYVNSYMTWLVLEKFWKDEDIKEGDSNWVKVYDKYEDFLNSQNIELINRAFYYINSLIYSN